MLTSILVLSLLIFFHELGHFIAAKAMGVKVETFSIGFGKKLLRTRLGETEWAISAIPLGGYVKMKGQVDTDPLAQSADSDSYSAKKPWQRIVILVAGPLANFLLAFLAYVVIALHGVPQLLPYIGKTMPNSPAQTAGLKAEDRIIAINGKRIARWRDVAETISQSDADTIALTIVREGYILQLRLTPKRVEDTDIYGEKVSRRVIGIYPSQAHTVIKRYDLLEAFDFAVTQTMHAATMIVTGLKKLITGAVSSDALGGVITIIDATAKASQYGLNALLAFAALISVNLGILNLLPIPALDGGHILFNLYEMIRGKAPSEAVLMRLTMAGWAFLLFVMGLGLYNDIHRMMH